MVSERYKQLGVIAHEAQMVSGFGGAAPQRQLRWLRFVPQPLRNY